MLKRGEGEGGYRERWHFPSLLRVWGRRPTIPAAAAAGVHGRRHGRLDEGIAQRPRWGGGGGTHSPLSGTSLSPYLSADVFLPSQ